MNFRQLEALRAVMVANSALGAAEILNISQPSVTRLLQNLERELGLTLFDRSSGRLVPTFEAQVLFDEAQRAFASVDKIKEIARDLRSLDAGKLDIASLPLLALGFIPRIAREFGERHPNVKITLNVQMSPKVEEWASAHLIDFGIADFPFEHEKFQRTGVAADEFCRTPYLLALPSDHPLATRKVIVPEDVANERFICLSRDTVGRHFIDQVFNARNIKRKLVIETTVAAIVANLVANGVGIGFIDPFTAADYRNRGIVTVPFQPAIFMRLALLHPVKRPITRVVKEFISLLRAARQNLLEASPAD